MISTQTFWIGDRFFQGTFAPTLCIKTSEWGSLPGASGQLETGLLLGSSRVFGFGTQRQAGYVMAASAVYEMPQSFITARMQICLLHTH